MSQRASSPDGTAPCLNKSSARQKTTGRMSFGVLDNFVIRHGRTTSLVASVFVMIAGTVDLVIDESDQRIMSRVGRPDSSVDK